MRPTLSGKRGYRILYLHCDKCDMERPFFRVNTWPTAQKKIRRRIPCNPEEPVGKKFVTLISPNPIPDLPATDHLVNAICMVCGKGAQYAVSEKVLGRSKYAMGDLCSCGLPVQHVGLHLEALRGKAK